MVRDALKPKNEGFTLVEALVALFVFCIIVMLFLKSIDNFSNLMKWGGAKNERDSILRIVTEQLDCDRTLTPMPTCDGKTLINLLNSEGISIFPENKFQSWQLQVFCDSIGFVIKGKSEKHFVKDWQDIVNDHQKNLFGLATSSIGFCHNYFIDLRPVLTVSQSLSLNSTATCDRTLNHPAVSAKKVYSGVAKCPKYYRVLSGGVICNSRATTIASQPDNDLLSWEASCCADENFISQGSMHVVATCILVLR